MLSRRTRLAAPVLLTATVLAFAGCGGGGGDEDAYIETYETACKKITTENAGFQKKLTDSVAKAGTDQGKVLQVVKEGTTDALSTLGEQVDELAGADAPEKWADFQDSIEKAADPLNDSIDEAKRKIEAAKSIQDFSELQNVFADLKLPDTKTPKDLESRIPSCKFGSSAS